MYFILKKGVNGHGIFYLSSSKEDAKDKCKEFAEADSDDYHSWSVYLFIEQPLKNAIDDAEHERVFTCKKKGVFKTYL